MPYRETITKTNDAGIHSQETNRRRWPTTAVFSCALESLDDDADFEFGSEIFGGSVSAPLWRLRRRVSAGVGSSPIAGYHVVGVKAVYF
ncbi:MAG: hypothetical protein M5U34_02385 [Chloroflexi bacterium]|nr:hypothetical protein [Chloroflexota bacterium]